MLPPSQISSSFSSSASTPFLVGCCVCSHRLAVVYAQDVLIFVSFSPFKLSPDSMIQRPPRTPTRPHLPSYPTSIAPTDGWLLCLFPVGEKLIAPWNAMHSVTVILKTRRTKAELHIKWINKVYIQFAFKVDLLLCLSSYVGSKNGKFLTPKGMVQAWVAKKLLNMTF